MSDKEVIDILARWTRELRFELELANRQIHALEQRVQRFEHVARTQALERRHWILNQNRELV